MFIVALCGVPLVAKMVSGTPVCVPPPVRSPPSALTTISWVPSAYLIFKLPRLSDLAVEMPVACIYVRSH